MEKTMLREKHSSSFLYIDADRIGFFIALYGVALILVWIGFFKFHPDEAEAISGIILASPFMSWLYYILDIDQASILIGTVEIVAGILLAAYPISRKAAVAGGVIASCIFLATVSFLLTTPGVLHTSSISGNTLAFPSLFGGFLLKDVVLLGVSLWIISRSGAEIVHSHH